MAETARVVRDYIQRGHMERMVQTMPITAKKLRVCAYCRVSTDSEDQLNSYEAQISHYTKYIGSKQDIWESAGIYADEGITGTKLRRRKNFNRMIADALDGKIDLIVVKSVSRFARKQANNFLHHPNERGQFPLAATKSA